MAPECWAASWGQWWAMNVLADIAPPLKGGNRQPRSLSVIATYGDPNGPTAWERLPAEKWRSLKTGSDFSQRKLRVCAVTDPESMPHRMWIKSVAGNRTNRSGA